ncbi:MAG: methyltransferase domain-containing protein [Anaerolineae bacterium]|nr:methyltransferase domain-containing protein [Anaerolineae bacterium]
MKKKCKRLQAFSVVFTAFMFYQAILRIVRRYWHFPAPPLIAPFLTSPARRFLQPTQRVLYRSGIQKGMTVLEIGCGNGAYIPTAARMVGPKGMVHALDVQPEMLKLLEAELNKAENLELTNVVLHPSDAAKLPFENEQFDVVFMVAVLSEIPDVPKALKEVKRVLKPDGRFAVTEFLPDPDYHLEHEIIRLGTKHGFVYETSAGNLMDYTVRFKVD